MNEDAIARRLRDGYGVEDIALLERIPLAEVRQTVQRFREEDRLHRIVGAMDRRRA